jgi:hypothetical protein
LFLAVRRARLRDPALALLLQYFAFIGSQRRSQMHSSSWPILLGLIAFIAGAIYFDAVHASPAAASGADLQAAAHAMK